MCMITGLVGTSVAMRITERICSMVPGLNTTWLMPTSLSSPMSSTASSRSGMPALTTRPSIAAPDWRAFCTSRLPPTCSFHR
ncbi:Uncharacterised protein [Mycobacterium tuberculosis]|nr:Uncharacterised protein [Mycobacterium tuberculosis]